MLDGEVLALCKDVKVLSDKADRQHMENQKMHAADREAFREAVNNQRDDFQKALNTQYLESRDMQGLVRSCLGDGQPGQGRLGRLEEVVETLKKFRWQALAAIFALLYALEHLEPLLKH